MQPLFSISWTLVMVLSTVTALVTPFLDAPEFGNSFVDIEGGPVNETITAAFGLTAGLSGVPVSTIGLRFMNEEDDESSDVDGNWFTCTAGGSGSGDDIEGCHLPNRFQVGAGAAVFGDREWMADAKKTAQYFCERMPSSDGKFSPIGADLVFSIVVTYNSTLQPSVWQSFYVERENTTRVYGKIRRTTIGVLPLGASSDVRLEGGSERSIKVGCSTSSTSLPNLAVVMGFCNGSVIAKPLQSSVMDGKFTSVAYFPYQSSLNNSRVICYTTIPYPIERTFSEYFTIDAQHQPLFPTSEPKPGLCRVNTQCDSLECGDVSFPSPKYTWTSDGDSTVLGLDRTLVIHKQFEKNGTHTFVCNAWNLKGHASRTFKMRVYGAPPYEGYFPALGIVGSNALIGCSVIGGILLIGLIVLAVVCYKKRRNRAL